MSGTKAQPDLIAVAMPLYGHAALALEAVESVLASTHRNCRVAIVVSVDGDPRHETFDQLLLYAATHPSVHVVFGQNAGPGGARNRAIEFVLEHLPEAQAVYFLDADNRVLPGTIGTLYEQLNASGCGWVYTNIDTFSVSWRAHYGNRYSRLVHCITDNICDTGSMISIDVFRAGVRFNDDRQNGFEDWEFWLSCIEAGFVGTPCHDTVFEYRLRAESRFKEANRDRSTSVSFLKKRHKALFQRPLLVDFEHEDCPRYLFARTEDAAISFFTDPTKPPQLLRLDDIIPAFWANIGEPDNVHFPPFPDGGKRRCARPDPAFEDAAEPAGPPGAPERERQCRLRAARQRCRPAQDRSGRPRGGRAAYRSCRSHLPVEQARAGCDPQQRAGLVRLDRQSASVADLHRSQGAVPVPEEPSAPLPHHAAADDDQLRQCDRDEPAAPHGRQAVDLAPGAARPLR